MQMSGDWIQFYLSAAYLCPLYWSSVVSTHHDGEHAPDEPHPAVELPGVGVWSVG